MFFPNILISKFSKTPTRNDSGDRPSGIPRVGVIIADGETEPGVGLEPARGRHHEDGRRAEREIRRKHQLAVVHSACKTHDDLYERIYSV